MKQLTLLALLAIASPAWADNPMKAGLWEVNILKQVMDGQDMLAQRNAMMAQMQRQMANMPPAQRKQMEQMMAGHAMPASGSQRICVSVAMAKQDKPVMAESQGCEPVKYERSGQKTTFEVHCNSSGQHMAGKGESTVNGNKVTTRMDMSMNDARGRHAMQTETEMTYLGPDCQGIKPADELMRGLKSAGKS